ncbi:Hypothetical predicted protein [Olea europaea subsp. europaea]|uniref:Uncharacterized protein n=1 Tax=Olea europaea subsp. europaea TaxID=158383 RepID=A0A8S0T7R2_OLEEU|nr:Hypothetical predicted protein [Olea europaea subsp. europaea]
MALANLLGRNLNQLIGEIGDEQFDVFFGSDTVIPSQENLVPYSVKTPEKAVKKEREIESTDCDSEAVDLSLRVYDHSAHREKQRKRKISKNMHSRKK